jgi:hypothetical protein
VSGVKNLLFPLRKRDIFEELSNYQLLKEHLDHGVSKHDVVVKCGAMRKTLSSFRNGMQKEYDSTALFTTKALMENNMRLKKGNGNEDLDELIFIISLETAQ